MARRGLARARTGWSTALPMAALLAIAASSGARLAAEPSSTPRLDWLFDGNVRATARIGNTLYVGGVFTGVAPRSDALGYWLTLSTSSGAALPGLPSLDGPVAAVEPDGAGGFFIAGTFTNAGAGGLAHIRADGAVDPAFVPQVAAPLNPRLVHVGPSLVVGGLAAPLRALDPVTGATSPWVPALPSPNVGPFEAANGRLFVMTSDGSGNRRVSAFDGATGAVVWASAVVGNPGGLGDVYSGAMAVAGARVIVALDRLYSLDAATGAIDPVWGGPETPSLTRRVDVLEVHGSTLFVAGTFTDFRGQARNNLAAVDIPTGALLPWNPASLGRVTALAVAPDGSVFVAAATIGGMTQGAFVQIDANGAVTGWTAQPLFRAGSISSLAISAAGELLVGVSRLAIAATTARASLAAFDLTTGALLPAMPVVAGSAPLWVSGLVSRGNILFLRGTFDSVNGQPHQKAAAVDVTSGTVLPWPEPGVPTMGADFGLLGWAFVFGDWLYGYLDGSTYSPLRRIHATTGMLDPVWRAEVPVGGALAVVPAHGELVAVQRLQTPASGIPDSRAGVLDSVTGVFLERSRSTVASIETLAVDGDTLYFADPSWNAFLHNVGALRAIDARTGRDVQVPAVSGEVSRVAVVDGRLFPRGGRFALGGALRDGVAEVARPGTLTAWPPALPGMPLLNPLLQVFGDVMVQGSGDGGYGRVLAFDLSGPAAPTNLRVRNVGAVTEFTWDAPAMVPPGGYVIEGGFGPGQTAAALPVGTATSLALPLPPGPIHVRVRAQGDTEVSNEVVAGCVAPPASPTGLTAALAGPNLTLAWAPPPDAVTTTLHAGTTSGSSNLATIALGGAQASIAGAVPPGTYFARMTASNACGTSGPSGEVFFTVGAAEALPAAPTNLAVSKFVDIFSVTATFTWTPPPGSVTGHQIEAGTGPGLANIATAQIGPGGTFVVPNVPQGAYYVRVRAVNAAGSGAPSADVAVVVP